MTGGHLDVEEFHEANDGVRLEEGLIPLGDEEGDLLVVRCDREDAVAPRRVIWVAADLGDVDVIDAAAMPPDYRVQLVPEEYAPGGVFERLTPWLDENMARFGFYRPYATGHGGAGAEPWHLSYWPVASQALEALTLPVLRRAVAGSEILGRDSVLERLPEIYTRFVLGVDFPGRPLVRVARRAGSAATG